MSICEKEMHNYFHNNYNKKFNFALNIYLKREEIVFGKELIIFLAFVDFFFNQMMQLIEISNI